MVTESSALRRVPTLVGSANSDIPQSRNCPLVNIFNLPRCGTANIPAAKFCVRCDSPMASSAQPQVPASPYGAPPPFFQPTPQYNDYAAAMAAQDRAREIDRTKTGLLLILIGVVLIRIPYVKFVGDILILVGAILVIVGRKAFGPIHARNTIWSIIIFAIGIAVIIAGSVAFALAVVSATIANSTGGMVDTTALGQSLSSAFNALLILSAVGGAIFGIAEALFTYALQRRTGKVLLWTGYATALAVSIIEFIIISPLIENAVSQSFTGTTYNPAPFANLQSQQLVLGLLNFIPAIIYASAIYLAWSRVKTGEIPGPAPQLTTLAGP